MKHFFSIKKEKFLFSHVRNIVEMLNFTYLSVVSSSSGYQLAAGVGTETLLANSTVDTARDLPRARYGAEPVPIAPPSPGANQGRPPPATEE